MTTDLARSVALVSHDTPPEDMILVRDRIDVAMAQLRELKQQLDEEYVIPAVKARGSVVIGSVVWRVAPDKDVKCQSVAETVKAVCKATEGDESALVACLSTNAFKHGACRKVLPPEVFERLFRTVVKDRLKDGTAAPLRLQAVDTKWLPQEATE